MSVLNKVNVISSVEYDHKICHKIVSRSQESIAGVFSTYTHSWLSSGPDLFILSNSDGTLQSYWTFGENFQDDLEITCAVELPLEGCTIPLLVLGLSSENANLVCFFNPNTRKILRTVDILYPVRTLCVIEDGTNEVNPLNDALSSTEGLLAIGCAEGTILLMDICRSILLKAIDWDFQYFTTEDNPSNAVYMGMKSVTASGFKQRVIDCRKKNDTAAVLLTEPTEEGITALLYSVESAIIFVGTSSGSFQMWNLSSLSCLFKSPATKRAVISLSLLEPCDDPRHNLFLWVCYEDYAQVAMYCITFSAKFFVHEYGVYYQNFEAVGLVYKFTLGMEVDAVASRPICSQAVAKLVPKNLVRCLSLPEAEGSQMRVFITAYEIVDKGETCNRALIFDLNQWYREQMPDEGVSSCLDSIDLDCQSLWHLQLDPKTLSLYQCVRPLEQHFYPSAFDFQVWCIHDDGIKGLEKLGLQSLWLRNMSEIGPRALLTPTRILHGAMAAGIFSAFVDPPDPDESTEAEIRSYVLALCLENRAISVIEDCAKNWSAGTHAVSGCTMQYLLDWLWELHKVYKTSGNKICVPLFDQSGIEFDISEKRSLQHCKSLLNTVQSVYVRLVNTCQLIRINGVEERLAAMSLVRLYFDYCVKLISVNLLPEPNEQGRPRGSIIYPYNSIHAHVNKRRKEGSFLGDSLFGQTGAENQWKEEGGDGCYPPPSIQSVLRFIVHPSPSLANKMSLLLYLYMDIVHYYTPIRGQAEKEKLKNFQHLMRISDVQFKIVGGLWFLDNFIFEDGVDFLLDPRVLTVDLSEDQHRVILHILSSNGQDKLALQYKRLKSPSLHQAEDLRVEMQLLLSNNLVNEAFQLQRKYPELRETLLIDFFQGCIERKQLGQVFGLNLDVKEEFVLMKYLQSSGLKEKGDLQVLLLLSKAKYNEAIHLNNRLNCTINGPKSRLGTDTRDMIVRGITGSLNPISRHMAQEMKTYRPPPSGTHPKPLSTLIKVRNGPDGPTCQSDSNALLCAVVRSSRHLSDFVNSFVSGRRRKRDEEEYTCDNIDDGPSRKRIKVSDNTEANQFPLLKGKWLPTSYKPSTPLDKSVMELVGTPIVKKLGKRFSPKSRPSSILKAKTPEKGLLAEELVDTPRKTIRFALPENEIAVTARKPLHDNDVTIQTTSEESKETGPQVSIETPEKKAVSNNLSKLATGRKPLHSAMDIADDIAKTETAVSTPTLNDTIKDRLRSSAKRKLVKEDIDWKEVDEASKPRVLFSPGVGRISSVKKTVTYKTTSSSYTKSSTPLSQLLLDITVTSAEKKYLDSPSRGEESSPVTEAIFNTTAVPKILFPSDKGKTEFDEKSTEVETTLEKYKRLKTTTDDLQNCEEFSVSDVENEDVTSQQMKFIDDLKAGFRKEEQKFIRVFGRLQEQSATSAIGKSVTVETQKSLNEEDVLNDEKDEQSPFNDDESNVEQERTEDGRSLDELKKEQSLQHKESVSENRSFTSKGDTQSRDSLLDKESSCSQHELSQCGLKNSEVLMITTSSQFEEQNTYVNNRKISPGGQRERPNAEEVFRKMEERHLPDSGNRTEKEYASKTFAHKKHEEVSLDGTATIGSSNHAYPLDDSENELTNEKLEHFSVSPSCDVDEVSEEEEEINELSNDASTVSSERVSSSGKSDPDKKLTSVSSVPSAFGLEGNIPRNFEQPTDRRLSKEKVDEEVEEGTKEVSSDGLATTGSSNKVYSLSDSENEATTDKDCYCVSVTSSITPTFDNNTTEDSEEEDINENELSNASTVSSDQGEVENTSETNSDDEYSSSSARSEDKREPELKNNREDPILICLDDSKDEDEEVEEDEEEGGEEDEEEIEEEEEEMSKEKCSDSQDFVEESSESKKSELEEENYDDNDVSDTEVFGLKLDQNVIEVEEDSEDDVWAELKPQKVDKVAIKKVSFKKDETLNSTGKEIQSSTILDSDLKSQGDEVVEIKEDSMSLSQSTVTNSPTNSPSFDNLTVSELEEKVLSVIGVDSLSGKVCRESMTNVSESLVDSNQDIDKVHSNTIDDSRAEEVSCEVLTIGSVTSLKEESTRETTKVESSIPSIVSVSSITNDEFFKEKSRGTSGSVVGREDYHSIELNWNQQIEDEMKDDSTFKELHIASNIGAEMSRDDANQSVSGEFVKSCIEKERYIEKLEATTDSSDHSNDVISKDVGTVLITSEDGFIKDPTSKKVDISQTTSDQGIEKSRISGAKSEAESTVKGIEEVKESNISEPEFTYSKSCAKDLSVLVSNVPDKNESEDEETRAKMFGDNNKAKVADKEVLSQNKGIEESMQVEVSDIQAALGGEGITGGDKDISSKTPEIQEIICDSASVSEDITMVHPEINKVDNTLSLNKTKIIAKESGEAADNNVSSAMFLEESKSMPTDFVVPPLDSSDNQAKSGIPTEDRNMQTVEVCNVDVEMRDESKCQIPLLEQSLDKEQLRHEPGTESSNLESDKRKSVESSNESIHHQKECSDKNLVTVAKETNSERKIITPGNESAVLNIESNTDTRSIASSSHDTFNKIDSDTNVTKLNESSQNEILHINLPENSKKGIKEQPFQDDIVSKKIKDRIVDKTDIKVKINNDCLKRIAEASPTLPESEERQLEVKGSKSKKETIESEKVLESEVREISTHIVSDIKTSCLNSGLETKNCLNTSGKGKRVESPSVLENVKNSDAIIAADERNLSLLVDQSVHSDLAAMDSQLNDAKMESSSHSCTNEVLISQSQGVSCPSPSRNKITENIVKEDKTNTSFDVPQNLPMEKSFFFGKEDIDTYIRAAKTTFQVGSHVSIPDEDEPVDPMEVAMIESEDKSLAEEDIELNLHLSPVKTEKPKKVDQGVVTQNSYLQRRARKLRNKEKSEKQLPIEDSKEDEKNKMDSQSEDPSSNQLNTRKEAKCISTQTSDSILVSNEEEPLETDIKSRLPKESLEPSVFNADLKLKDKRKMRQSSEPPELYKADIKTKVVHERLSKDSRASSVQDVNIKSILKNRGSAVLKNVDLDKFDSNKEGDLGKNVGMRKSSDTDKKDQMKIEVQSPLRRSRRLSEQNLDTSGLSVLKEFENVSRYPRKSRGYSEEPDIYRMATYKEKQIESDAKDASEAVVNKHRRSRRYSEEPEDRLEVRKGRKSIRVTDMVLTSSSKCPSEDDVSQKKCSKKLSEKPDTFIDDGLETKEIRKSSRDSIINKEGKMSRHSEDHGIVSILKKSSTGGQGDIHCSKALKEESKSHRDDCHANERRRVRRHSEEPEMQTAHMKKKRERRASSHTFETASDLKLRLEEDFPVRRKSRRNSEDSEVRGILKNRNEDFKNCHVPETGEDLRINIKNKFSEDIKSVEDVEVRGILKNRKEAHGSSNFENEDIRMVEDLPERNRRTRRHSEEPEIKGILKKRGRVGRRSSYSCETTEEIKLVEGGRRLRRNSEEPQVNDILMKRSRVSRRNSDISDTNDDLKLHLDEDFLEHEESSSRKNLGEHKLQEFEVENKNRKAHSLTLGASDERRPKLKESMSDKDNRSSTDNDKKVLERRESDDMEVRPVETVDDMKPPSSEHISKTGRKRSYSVGTDSTGVSESHHEDSRKSLRQSENSDVKSNVQIRHSRKSLLINKYREDIEFNSNIEKKHSDTSADPRVPSVGGYSLDNKESPDQFEDSGDASNTKSKSQHIEKSGAVHRNDLSSDHHEEVSDDPAIPQSVDNKPSNDKANIDESLKETEIKVTRKSRRRTPDKKVSPKVIEERKRKVESQDLFKPKRLEYSDDESPGKKKSRSLIDFPIRKNSRLPRPALEDIREEEEEEPRKKKKSMDDLHLEKMKKKAAISKKSNSSQIVLAESDEESDVATPELWKKKLITDKRLTRTQQKLFLMNQQLTAVSEATTSSTPPSPRRSGRKKADVVVESPAKVTPTRTSLRLQKKRPNEKD